MEVCEAMPTCVQEALCTQTSIFLLFFWLCQGALWNIPTSSVQTSPHTSVIFPSVSRCILNLQQTVDKWSKNLLSYLPTLNIIASVLDTWLYERAVSAIVEKSSDGGNPGNKNCKRGYNGVYGRVWHNFCLVGVWSQAVCLLLVNLAGILLQWPWICFHI
jgi:hypothetical protein